MEVVIFAVLVVGLALTLLALAAAVFVLYKLVNVLRFTRAEHDPRPTANRYVPPDDQVERARAGKTMWSGNK